jgi:hypothetical protein
VLLSLLLACACGGGVDPEVPLTTGAPAPSLADYATSVHPILEARCATLDCHGDLGRPLRLYAETGLRALDSLRRNATPITPDELNANLRAILAVDPSPPSVESLFMSKPLAGGIDHAGGDVWASPADPQPACVLGWLQGRSADPVVAAACAAAAGEVALPP